MPYDDYEDRETSLDRGSELYDEDIYEETDSFGERLGSAPLDDDMADDDLSADDTMAGDELTEQSATSEVEEGFGETLAGNPHLEDQLDDDQLSREAEADYAPEDTGHKDESLLDKAKDKFNELTGHDKEK
jgi:hypothetical protein